ncbi:hypothetical protein F8S09_08180 [Deinococcus sp. SDU3-2]|uniref:Lipoprotein n=1 Tax=Deinococcus terrestris TaxID=2651870 RepID=A0A7X1TRE8_9DEIO|nr:hypothetical protein [Deinococcus terrestris]MPY66670.1 hypothetical protein [Deinococcus terrestris]
MITLPGSFSMRLLGVGALCVSLLTACPGPGPRPTPYLPPSQLSFTFPTVQDTTDVKLAAVAFVKDEKTGGYQSQVVTFTPLSGPAASSATLFLDGYRLDTWAKNPACTTPFLGGETAGMQEVTVTPNTVRTCNLYFMLFRDANRNGAPESGEVLYETHDLYSYATEAFTYRFVSPDGRSTETGTRTKGWSLVRHQVLQPSATPGRYLVSMNSLPSADERLNIRLHERTDYFTSQGLSLGGGQK